MDLGSRQAALPLFQSCRTDVSVARGTVIWLPTPSKPGDGCNRQCTYPTGSGTPWPASLRSGL